MLSKRKRVGAILAAVAFAASLVLTQAVASAPAQARCAAAAEVVSELIIDNTTYMTETPTSGTCNGTNFYSSEFRSLVSGWRASVRIQNNGRWTTHYGGYNTVPIRLEYQDDNSDSLMVLCVDKDNIWKCGYYREYSESLGGPTANFWRHNTGF